MACPDCKCKETYEYNYGDLDIDPNDISMEYERCANCGHIFWIEDGLPEDDDPYIPEPEDFMIQGGKG